MTSLQRETRIYFQLFLKKKSSFPQKRKNFSGEIHLSILKDDIFSLDKRFSSSNFVYEEKQAV